MRAPLACLFLATLGSLPAQTVRTIVNNGPTNNRYDVVILGDGYRDVEEGRFDADCLTFTAALFNKEPYATFGGYFNVHTVFRASRESGADHPDANPPIVRDTVYDASYNTGGTPRCLYIRNTSQALADAALAPATEGRILVMVNDARYGGCASTFAVSYNGTSMTEVQIHEMGHSVGGLADEYWYTGQSWGGGEPGEPNATADSSGNKWSAWLGSNGIGAFQGCRYCEFGLYRPWSNCLMNSLGRPLCSVCAEALVLRAHVSAAAIDLPQPPVTQLSLSRGVQQVFSFTNIAPPSSNALVTWRLDGTPVASATTSYTLDTVPLALGRHTVEAEVLDRTAFVRRDPTNLLRQSRRWDVDVNGPGADLVLDALVPSATTIPAGSPIDVSTTVRNAGTLPAGTFDVSLFLSADPVIDNQDVYLGRSTVAGLGAGGSVAPARTGVQVPSFVLPGSYYLGAMVDFDGQVRELDENNNVRVVPVQVTATSCTPALELRDMLLYPKDDVTLRLGSFFPFTMPTVTSRCTPGVMYLLLWGCSGRSPGTPIAGFTLPLNLDACTEVSLSWRGPFANFIGTLDANGVGRPSFVMLGVPYVGDFDTDLAALVFEASSLRVLGVTNAVRVALRQ
ncbi:MAG: M64 family metallopeptidase [Planctomycetota bacterium]